MSRGTRNMRRLLACEASALSIVVSDQATYNGLVKYLKIHKIAVADDFIRVGTEITAELLS